MGGKSPQYRENPCSQVGNKNTIHVQGLGFEPKSTKNKPQSKPECPYRWIWPRDLAGFPPSLCVFVYSFVFSPSVLWCFHWASNQLAKYVLHDPGNWICIRLAATTTLKEMTVGHSGRIAPTKAIRRPSIPKVTRAPSINHLLPGLCQVWHWGTEQTYYHPGLQDT